MQKLYIVGAGMGDTGSLTEKAVNIIKSADVVYGSSRLSSQYTIYNENIKAPEYKDLLKALEDETLANVCVLLSGDTGFYSYSKKLMEYLKDKYDIEVVEGISSLQYFMAKLKLSYNNIHIVSMHGRTGSITGRVCYNEYTFILTGGENKAHNIISELYGAGLTDVYVYIGENLGSDSEKIVSGSVSEIKDMIFSDLAVMVVYNKEYVKDIRPLKDDDFIRGKAPMTKEDIRWLSTSYLDPKETDIIYDIGAGTGSVSMDLAGKAKYGKIYAIEKNEEAYSLLNENRKKLKRYNVECIFGSAPLALENLPAPDRVFIGGSSNNMIEIFDVIISKNEKVRITVTAITLETIHAAINAFKKYDIDPGIVCINSAKSKKVAGYNMMMGNNPVYIMTGEK